MVNFSTFGKKYRADLMLLIPLLVVSAILLWDTLVFQGQPANMDGTVHITNIAIFHDALADGDFPVRWTDGFARYGLPMGSFAQQVTSYLGAFFTFVTQDVVTSFNWVYAVGTVVSVLLWYGFLRIYVSAPSAFVGSFLFNFAPYRIINLYIRGALPEYFSSVFVVAILISSYLLIKKKVSWSFLGLVLSVYGLVLTHPMNAVTGSFIIAPYILFLLWQEKYKFRLAMLVASAFGLAAVIAAYYLVPLFKEIEYTYYGKGNYYNDSHLYLNNFFNPNWYYSLPEYNEILSRGHFIKVGVVESIVMLVGVVIFGLRRFKKKTLDMFDVSVMIGVVTLLMTLKVSAPLYKNIDILSNIQFPWRMLSTFIFIPPFIAAYTIEKYRLWWLGLLLVIIVAFARFPQLYGKNFSQYPQSFYYFTLDNLHTSNMNTVWMGQVEEYPVKNEQVEIIEGEGQIENVTVTNSNRSFTLTADSEVRVADYTFYFPGWHVYVDGVEQEIVYQDPAYRGVITYTVPSGEHSVVVEFTDTKTVLLGNTLSLIGWVGIAALLLIQRKFLVIERLAYLK